MRHRPGLAIPILPAPGELCDAPRAQPAATVLDPLSGLQLDPQAWLPLTEGPQEGLGSSSIKGREKESLPHRGLR